MRQRPNCSAADAPGAPAESSKGSIVNSGPAIWRKVMVMASVGAAPATSPGRKYIGTANRKVVLAALWTVATANYLYCDLFTSMEPTYVRDLVSQGKISGITVSQGFLLGSTVLMEIPIAMIQFSRVL